MPEGTCPICQKPLVVRSNARTCGDANCLREYHRAKNRKYQENRLKMLREAKANPGVCPVCQLWQALRVPIYTPPRENRTIPNVCLACRTIIEQVGGSPSRLAEIAITYKAWKEEGYKNQG